MEEKEIAMVLLQLITKQNYRNQEVKKHLKSIGLLYDSGHMTYLGKRYVWDYFSKLNSEIKE